jgi:hypothetical protein
MSERVGDFLEGWIATHVAHVSPARKLDESDRLTKACRRAAQEQGISEAEMASASRDLRNRMLLSELARLAGYNTQGPHRWVVCGSRWSIITLRFKFDGQCGE